ncbi:MAG: hypothetical protein V3S89_09480 [Desulfobacterales bacterium]
MDKSSRQPFSATHLFLAIAIVLMLTACGPGTPPIEKLKQNLKDVPTYSIILADMKEEGNFSSQYFHKYRVILPESSEDGTTDWWKVPKDYYKLNEALLGMALAVKKDGSFSSSAAPPGYQYVGDAKYGQWRSDSRGGSFWEFYGKYALFSSLVGGRGRPIYRSDYDTYRQHRSRNTPYFGSNKQYGTSGSYTKQAKPNFYSRRATREKMKRTSFKNRVAKRTGRTRTGYRSRAGGFGK